MMFLDCPAYLDHDGATRCGLPAEVTGRFTMRSTDGPLESAMIRCPSGHWFNGPLEFLTWERAGKRDPADAAAARSAASTDGTADHGGCAGRGRPVTQQFPGEPRRANLRPVGAPAYYLGRPAGQWITAMRPRRTGPQHSPDASRHPQAQRHFL
jgi:hypothetical protein